MASLLVPRNNVDYVFQIFKFEYLYQQKKNHLRYHLLALTNQFDGKLRVGNLTRQSIYLGPTFALLFT